MMEPNKIILDACCGGRMFWFDKNQPNTIYVDYRTAPKGHIGYKGWESHEVKPDYVMDFRKLEFPDQSFKLVVFDPPHLLNAGPKSYMRKKYGILNAETWQYDLKKGFQECWRVLENYGVLVFKWNDTQISLKKVLGIIKRQPLFGHTTTSKNKTTWLCFMKIPEDNQNAV